jgi:hypothetical protein
MRILVMWKRYEAISARVDEFDLQDVWTLRPMVDGNKLVKALSLGKVLSTHHS